MQKNLPGAKEFILDYLKKNETVFIRGEDLEKDPNHKCFGVSSAHWKCDSQKPNFSVCLFFFNQSEMNQFQKL